MRYIHKTLIENEQIIYMTRPHWIIFAGPVATLFLALCIFLFGDQLIVLNMKIYKLTLFEVAAILVALYGLYHFSKVYIF